MSAFYQKLEEETVAVAIVYNEGTYIASLEERFNNRAVIQVGSSKSSPNDAMLSLERSFNKFNTGK